MKVKKDLLLENVFRLHKKFYRSPKINFMNNLNEKDKYLENQLIIFLKKSKEEIEHEKLIKEIEMKKRLGKIKGKEQELINIKKYNKMIKEKNLLLKSSSNKMLLNIMLDNPFIRDKVFSSKTFFSPKKAINEENENKRLINQKYIFTSPISLSISPNKKNNNNVVTLNNEQPSRKNFYQSLIKQRNIFNFRNNQSIDGFRTKINEYQKFFRSYFRSGVNKNKKSKKSIINLKKINKNSYNYDIFSKNDEKGKIKTSKNNNKINFSL